MYKYLFKKRVDNLTQIHYNISKLKEGNIKEYKMFRNLDNLFETCDRLTAETKELEKKMANMANKEKRKIPCRMSLLRKDGKRDNFGKFMCKEDAVSFATEIMAFDKMYYDFEIRYIGH